MNKQRLATVAICRAGIIAALYVVLTMPFGQLAFGQFQIRPSEALTILPLFYWEAIPGLYVGCMLSNICSAFGIFDVLLGSLASLIAALATYAVGRLFANKPLKIVLGCIPPIVCNVFIVPAVWLLTGDYAYWFNVACMLLNESIWVIAPGVPLFFLVDRLIGRRIRCMLPCSQLAKKPIKTDKNAQKTA